MAEYRAAGGGASLKAKSESSVSSKSKSHSTKSPVKRPGEFQSTGGSGAAYKSKEFISDSDSDGAGKASCGVGRWFGTARVL